MKQSLSVVNVRLIKGLPKRDPYMYSHGETLMTAYMKCLQETVNNGEAKALKRT